MKEYVNESAFISRFADIGRSENFTYGARKALFEYFEALEDDIGEEIEFDPIAICCDWSEYPCISDACDDYGIENPIEIEDNTTVIYFDDGVLIQAF